MEKNEKKALLCLRGGEAEITEKKSRFIARVAAVKSEEEAIAFLAGVRKQHREARHNCYAYITGEDGAVEKFSDDGEPAKTAGLPMLELLRKKGLRDVCVVVTRYFGGILLGTGGLVRAYSAAAAAALDASLFSERLRGRLIRWSTDYSFYGKLQYLAEEETLSVMETEFGEAVSITLLVPEEKAEQIIARVSEQSAGRVLPEEIQKVRYCKAGTCIEGLQVVN